MDRLQYALVITNIIRRVNSFSGRLACSARIFAISGLKSINALNNSLTSPFVYKRSFSYYVYWMQLPSHPGFRKLIPDHALTGLFFSRATNEAPFSTNVLSLFFSVASRLGSNSRKDAVNISYS